MRNNINTQILCFLVLITSGVAFGQTQVPNTFQSGQPARAAEVNDNFSILEAGVNTNASAITAGDAAITINTQATAAVAAVVVPRVKANGQDIGTFLGTSGGSQFFFSSFWVLSDKDYIFHVAARETNPSSGSTGLSGEILWQLLRFTTANCSGQAYVGVDTPGDGSPALLRSGVVFPSTNFNDPLVYYSPKGSTPISGLLVQSRSSDSGCTAEGNTAIDLIAVFPNDPLVTGVPNQRNFDPPITLGVQTFQVSPP